MKPIQGKVAAIVTERQIVINRGRDYGIEKGMIFFIKLSIPDIIDPDNTTNILEGTYYEKGRIRIIQTFEKMSFGILLPKLRFDNDIYFPTIDTTQYIVAQTDWIIRIGDTIIQLEEKKVEEKSITLYQKFIKLLKSI